MPNITTSILLFSFPDECVHNIYVLARNWVYNNLSTLALVIIIIIIIILGIYYMLFFSKEHIACYNHMVTNYRKMVTKHCYSYSYECCSCAITRWRNSRRWTTTLRPSTSSSSFRTCPPHSRRRPSRP